MGPPVLEDILRPVWSDLGRVETYMAGAVSGDLPLSREVLEHVLSGGGKRLRPALVLLSGKLSGGKPDQLIPASAAMELLHTATLIHDDVVDRSDVRRGRRTVTSRWDPGIAVLGGDLLFAVAFSILSSYQKPRILSVMSDVILELCQGEISQYSLRGSLEITEDYYLDLTRKKTASLMAASMLLGGIISGADEETQDRLHRYGLNLGMAFQIADDILDFCGDSDSLGKPVVSDLRNGVITLPLIHALKDRKTGPELRSILGDRGATNRDVNQQVVLLVQKSGGIQYARQVAASYQKRALEPLGGFQRGPALKGLERLVGFVGDRRF